LLFSSTRGSASAVPKEEHTAVAVSTQAGPTPVARFVHSEPYHSRRARDILTAHPDVRGLFGPNPWSAAWLASLVLLQLALQIALAGCPIWIQLLIAYVFGAFVIHALWTLVHECSHDLVFHNKLLNRWAAIFANLPILLPSTVSYAIYHHKHHAKFSYYRHDTDVPSAWERWLLHGGVFRRLLWAALLPLLFQGVRRTRILASGRPRSWERFLIPNAVVQWAFVAAWLAASYWFLGQFAIWYLLGSAYFSNALHPLVGRWIQEHYVVREGQETNDYYGALNAVAFNIGYHNEHHDFPAVSWNRLPALRRIAAEAYEPLFAYKSWTALFFQFVFDHNFLAYRLARRD
jgi:sphingolipid delta-4 desaturase